jgi:hypothetical protein
VLVEIALCSYAKSQKDTQPSQTCSGGYTFEIDLRISSYTGPGSYPTPDLCVVRKPKSLSPSDYIAAAYV